jgi:ribose 5-phosphate isomerase B
LTLGERVIGVELAKSIVDAYLGAEPQGGRHERRREQIASLERPDTVVADGTQAIRRGR